MVEIAKGLFNESRILVMDEPTAVLTGKESEALFGIIETLKRQSVSIIYISHRLEEVQRICDRVTVLRDGKFVAEIDNAKRDVSKDLLVRYMVGRELSSYFPPRSAKAAGEKVIEVSGLCKRGMFQDISFDLRKGEILGFFGLVGAGRTELMKAIFGEIQADSGQVRQAGVETKNRRPMDAIGNRIAFVPEDRKKEGLILSMSLSDNVALPNPRLVSGMGILRKGKKANLAAESIEKVRIRPALPERQAGEFSGGNQQKIVLGKWLATKPQVMILDEPTRGIDIGAKREIYDIIARLTAEGVSIILVSSEMLEVMGISDRIVVMHEGRITGEFDNEGLTQERLMACASGVA
jgi:ribose transport system ATP-binding protein